VAKVQEQHLATQRVPPQQPEFRVAQDHIAFAGQQDAIARAGLVVQDAVGAAIAAAVGVLQQLLLRLSILRIRIVFCHFHEATNFGGILVGTKNSI